MAGLRAAQANPVDRALRFLAWYGLFVGAVGALCNAGVLYRWSGIVARAIRAAAWSLVLRFGGVLIQQFLSILLVIAAIQFLRSRGHRLLMGWAIASIAASALVQAAAVWDLLSMGLSNWLMLPVNLAAWVNRSTFAALVLALVVLGQRASRGGRGFPVRGAEAWPDDAAEALSADDRVKAYTLMRLLGGFGCVVALVLLAGLASQLLLGWRISLSAQPLRLAVATLLNVVTPASCVLLLVGASMVLLDRVAGVRLMASWAVLYVICWIAYGCLYTIPYLYWIATKPAPEPQTPLELALLRLYTGSEGVALGLAMLYVCCLLRHGVQEQMEPCAKAPSSAGHLA
jgi:hypothetical protein